MNKKDKTMAGKRTDKAKQQKTQVVPEKPLTQREQTRLDSYHQKLKAGMEAPGFEVTHAKGKVNLHPKQTDNVGELLHSVGVAECFGTGNQTLNHSFLNQLLSLVDTEAINTNTINTELALMHSIKPRDALETMLVIQMVATHQTMLIYSRKLLQKGSYSLEQVNSYLNAITKLSRTYTTQMDTLNKHRGKGQQKMTVEHVHVNAGGQAIIGSVTHPGRGEATQETVEAPHAP